MKLSLCKFIVFSTMFSISISSFAFPDITGKWRCSGYDPFMKQNFTVSGEIKKTGETYALDNWKNDATGEKRSGTAFHNGKIKNSLAVAFSSNEDTKKVGFGIFKVLSENKIIGTWTIRNGTMKAKEICERIDAKKLQS